MALRIAQPADASSIAAISIEVWVGTYLKKGVNAFFADWALSEFTTEKTRQLMDDRTQFRKNMADELAAPVDGVATAELHKDARETVTYHHIDAGAAFELEADGGIEALMIGGEMTESGDALRKGSWLRIPEGGALKGVAGPNGAKVWVKTGHLPFAQAPAV